MLSLLNQSIELAKKGANRAIHLSPRCHHGARFYYTNGMDNEKVENVVVARFDGQGY